MDDDGRYNDWVQNNIDNLRELYCEKMELEFEEFCFERYTTDTNSDDDLYERYRDDHIEDNEV